MTSQSTCPVCGQPWPSDPVSRDDTARMQEASDRVALGEGCGPQNPFVFATRCPCCAQVKVADSSGRRDVTSEQVDAAARALYEHWCEAEGRDLGEWDSEDFVAGFPRREAWREQARVAFRAAGFTVAS